MNLNESDRQKVKKWLESKMTRPNCSICGTASWTFFEGSTISIGINIETTRFDYFSGLPRISIICKNCGQIVDFSPAIIGVKPKE